MKAICRVAKIKGSGSITGKSEHNYRQGHVPNADKERQHLNKEYVLNYESLGKAIQARIEHAGIQKVRQDAVKGMEFILTASPELFKRDQSGQVTGDYRESLWLKANLDFMKQQYGSNLVAFTLHQDEKTPHIHAIVVPITPDNRLCAKELFNPKTLKVLQTDYAQAMKPFGLERGIEGSRAKHVEMKHIYGLQQQERKAIEQELAPIQQTHPPLQIGQPGVLDLFNLERWKQQQEAQINAEYTRRLDEIKKAAEKAQNAAVANATAKEQGKVLKQRLNTSERLKQGNHEKLVKTQDELGQSRQKLKQVAVLSHQDRLNPEWSKQIADQAYREVSQYLDQHLKTILKEPVHQINDVFEKLRAQGYKLVKEKETLYLAHEPSQVRLGINSINVENKSLIEAISQAKEKSQQKEQEQTQKAKPSRGFKVSR